MAQATHHSTRFHNLSNEALADVLGHADAVLKGAEAECKALKGEAKRRGLLEATGENFAIRVAEQISGRLDVAAVKEHLEDLEETEDGLRVRIRQSMTDQEGRGVVIAIPLGQVACPVKSLKAWLHASGITSGPVFRPIGKGERLLDSRLTDRSVAKIVKIHAARADSIRRSSPVTHCARAFSHRLHHMALRSSKWPISLGTRAWTHCAATCATQRYLKTTRGRDCFRCGRRGAPRRVFFADRH